MAQDTPAQIRKKLAAARSAVTKLENQLAEVEKPAAKPSGTGPTPKPLKNAPRLR